MKNCLIVTTIIIAFCQITTAQQYRFLRSMEYERMMLLKDTSLQRKIHSIETQITEFAKVPEIKLHQLPIVFHVLYQEGGKYPGQAQIENQLKELNKNFKLKGYKSKHPASQKEKFEEREANVEIEFCLSIKDPSSKDITGINFVKTWVSEFGLNNDMKAPERGGISPWDVNKYINVWVVNLADSVSGFAQMPGRNPLTDGIVIDYDFIGSKKELLPPYDEGKTLVHLLGNYLGLYDLWGPCPCCDDNIADTPIHNVPNFGSNEKYKKLSTCYGNPVEMTMNFMDNSDDEWMEMFTSGQKSRMQAALSVKGSRSQLSSYYSLCSKNFDEEPTFTRQKSQKTIEIYPNPAGSYIEVSVINSQPSQITIIDSQGKLIYVQKMKGRDSLESMVLDITKWQSGQYFILMNDAEETTSGNFIIQH